LILCACVLGFSNAAAQSGSCIGDCGGNELVTVDELVTEVKVALDELPLDACSHSSGPVGTADLKSAVSNALAGCSVSGNRAPLASDLSFGAEATMAYLEKQLIGSDPDNDSIAYELIGEPSGTGYDFAFVNADSGTLYLTPTPGFLGTIALPIITDYARFSNTATATIEVQEAMPSRNTGLQDIDPKVYAGHPRAFYDGTLLAPGTDPTLPSSVDLSSDFPARRSGTQSSCVGWARLRHQAIRSARLVGR
jgi:hypothetical protein